LDHSVYPLYIVRVHRHLCYFMLFFKNLFSYHFFYFLMLPFLVKWRLSYPTARHRILDWL